jgi:hypothetical protein
MAGTNTVSVVELTKIVDGRPGLLGDARVWPFQSMLDEGVNDFPVTVKVKLGPPAWMLVGERALMEGAGKLICC